MTKTKEPRSKKRRRASSFGSSVLGSLLLLELLNDTNQEFRESVRCLEGVFAQLPKIFGRAEPLEDGPGGGAELAGQALLSKQMFDFGWQLVIHRVADDADRHQRHALLAADFGDAETFHVTSDRLMLLGQAAALRGLAQDGIDGEQSADVQALHSRERL